MKPPNQLAPSWLPRRQRRRIDHQLHKFYRTGCCSLCGQVLPHNTRTAAGLTARGDVALAGECCLSQIAATFTLGLYVDRQYDFLLPSGDQSKAKAQPTAAQLAEAARLYQNVVTEADKVVDDIMRRCGNLPITPELNLQDTAWKNDDRDWFVAHPNRSHRLRPPFPGEADKQAANVPAGHVLIVLVRQVEPGTRIRPPFYRPADLLPVPDNEAAAHGLFEVALGHEPMPADVEALDNLVQKYTPGKSQ